MSRSSPCSPWCPALLAGFLPETGPPLPALIRGWRGPLPRMGLWHHSPTIRRRSRFERARRLHDAGGGARFKRSRVPCRRWLLRWRSTSPAILLTANRHTTRTGGAAHDERDRANHDHDHGSPRHKATRFRMRIEDINKQILSYCAGPRRDVAGVSPSRAATRPTKRSSSRTSAARPRRPVHRDLQWRDASYYAVMFAGDRLQRERRDGGPTRRQNTTWFNPLGWAFGRYGAGQMHLCGTPTPARVPAARLRLTGRRAPRDSLDVTADYCGDGKQRVCPTARCSPSTASRCSTRFATLVHAAAGFRCARSAAPAAVTRPA